MEDQKTDIKKMRYEKTRQPLARYVKNPLVKYAKIQVVCAALILIAIAMLFFVPMFSIEFENLDVYDSVSVLTLPKVQAALESALKSGNTSISSVSFSVFDELKLFFNSIETMADTNAVALSIGILFEMLALVFFLAAAILAIKSLVINLSRACYTSSKNSIYNYTLNNYAENMLAEITYRPAKFRDWRKQGARGETTYLLCISAIALVLQVICLAIFSSINSQLFDLVYEGEADVEGMVSYMSYFNSANLWMLLTVIVVVAAVILCVYNLRLKSDLCEQIAICEMEAAQMASAQAE